MAYSQYSVLEQRECADCKNHETGNAGWYKDRSSWICSRCYARKRRIKLGIFQDFKKKLNQRQCSHCGSPNTLVSTNKHGYKYKRWTRDGNGGWYCDRCYKVVNYTPSVRRRWNERGVCINGKRLFLAANPRTGSCSNCGKSVQKGEIPYTSMYCRDRSITPNDINLENIHDYATELCSSCMNIVLRERKIIPSRWINHQYKMDRFLHLRQRYYPTSEWIAIRKQVLSKYNSSCVECGSIRDDKDKLTEKPKLHIHHVKPWSEYPELRFSIENLVPLCERCHRKGTIRLKKEIQLCQI